MTALRKILIEEETVFTAPVSRAPAKLYVVANNATPAVEEGSATKNIALFFLAPFIGLAYMVLFPLAGLGCAGGAGRPRGGQIRSGPRYRHRCEECRAGGCGPGPRPRLHRPFPRYRPRRTGLDRRPGDDEPVDRWG